MCADDLKGEWTKVTCKGGHVYDVYIGESEDRPELEDMLLPPSKTRNAPSG